MFAPLVRGANRQIALAALLPLGLAIVCVLLAITSYRWLSLPEHTAHLPLQDPLEARPRWWWSMVFLLALSPLWVGLLQLIPVSADLWATLAGHAPYLTALAAAGATPPAHLPITLQPSATWAAIWSAVPVVAVFLAALFINTQNTEKLLRLLLLSASLQALLGLLQLVQGPKSILYFGSVFGSGVIGSFNNRNHLADFLAMLLPVWFYFLTARQTHGSGSHRAHGQGIDARKPLWGFWGFAMLVMILSTQSRGGLLSSIIVLLLCIVLFLVDLGSKLSSKQKIGIFALFLVFCSISLLVVELDSLGQRLQGTQLQTDADVRNAYALATLEAARTFWPWGSGLGSFEAVFPRFQPMQTPGYVNHAHNDYAQWLMEAGLASLVVMALLLVLVGLQVQSLRRAAMARLKGKRLSTDIALRCYAGLGALALMLHSWVEFNMRIPALAITAAFLLGVFLRPLSKQSVRNKSRHSHGAA